MGGLIKGILGAFNPVADLVDNLHTSDEERLELKAKLIQSQVQLLSQAVDFEKAAIEAQARVVTAEAQSDGWLTRSWRPLTMLVFVSLLVLHWLGIGPAELPEPLWVTIQIGLGGYIGGRSLEKALPPVVEALKGPEKT